MADYKEYRKPLGVAGRLNTVNLKCAADEYHVGMPLKYNTTNDNYEYGVTGSSGFAGICIESKTLSSAGDVLAAVTGTDFMASELKTDVNGKLAVTDDLRQGLLSAGIVLK